MTAPQCRFCGKTIPPYRASFNLRTTEQAARGIGGSDWITVDKLPQSREEAQRLTNHKIGKLYWATPGTSAKGINGFTAWDGETYELRHGYFCKVDCAARFGRHMAERGARV